MGMPNRMRRGLAGLSSIIAGAVVASCQPMDRSAELATPPPELAEGPTVVNGETMRRLDIAQAGHAVDWPSYSRTWDEQRFSRLAQINEHTVSQLGLAWYDDLETMRGVQASPLVIDG